MPEQSPQEAPCYTLIHQADAFDAQSSLGRLRQALEKGSDDAKIDALRQIIIAHVNGETGLDGLLMHVIRFVLPSKNKILKKLLLFYWEICPKRKADGTPREELILVVNALLNDLQSPNEYVRGATLRLLCKMRDPEVVTPLIPAVRECLKHRVSYVRRNAVNAISSLYQAVPALIPDAVEFIEIALAEEVDSACKRAMFVMLCDANQQAALSYLAGVLDQFDLFDDTMQTAAIELIRKEYHRLSSTVGGMAAGAGSRARGAAGVEPAKLLQAVHQLATTASTRSWVRFEAASAILAMTTHPTLVKDAARTLISLVVSEPDSNIKLTILDMLERMRAEPSNDAVDRAGVLADLALDCAPILLNLDVEVRRKGLGFMSSLLSRQNVREMVALFKKELARTIAAASESKESEAAENAEYRQQLLSAVNSCAQRFPDVASDVAHVLFETLTAELDNSTGSSKNQAGADVVGFLRELTEVYADLRPSIVAELIGLFGSNLRGSRVIRGALWILGEFAITTDEIRSTWDAIRASIGPIPLLSAEQAALDRKNSGDDAATSPAASSTGAGSSGRRILADGTYATESAFGGETGSPAGSSGSERPAIRALLLDGDFFVATSLANALTKLVLRINTLARSDSAAVPAKDVNLLHAEAMLILTGIIRLGHSQFVKTGIDEDSTDRINTCLRVLDALSRSRIDPATKDAAPSTGDQEFIGSTHRAFSRFVERGRAKADAQRKAVEAASPASGAKIGVSVDDGIRTRWLSRRGPGGGVAGKPGSAPLDQNEVDMRAALGRTSNVTAGTKRLDSVVQLTGYSDPVYCEAYLTIRNMDIALDFLVVNQTSDTLRNLSLELATLGDLKVVERPGTYNLGPQGFLSCKATVKVSSTETGLIFGNIVYDGPGHTDAISGGCVILNDIPVDIMEYIKPGTVTLAQFRSMWAEFEWENKVTVNPPVETDLRKYLQHIMDVTHMACLTPEAALSGDCGFLAANLYARSSFGEDALANISIEKQGNGPIVGHIRIRSKLQGIALGLGDKITLAQKAAAASAAAAAASASA
ncbi:Coatomer, beta subunit [Ramicandelaber brevisporus]|nr:Coatomer, beta subunit [Ramicandelaber brevisporus]